MLCFKTTFFICPICEASLSHHTFVYGKFGPRIFMYYVISPLARKTNYPPPPTPKQKSVSLHQKNRRLFFCLMHLLVKYVKLFQKRFSQSFCEISLLKVKASKCNPFFFILYLYFFFYKMGKKRRTFLRFLL